MKTIHVLDSDTINKIAAGEVVERPSSVVKELVENAIDAKASAITIEIKEGGISFIRVTDNGAGIDKDDIETAFLRHATSKIETAMDLLTVGSLGFRGEALSSIASVAQIELITKVHRELLGIRYCIDGGEFKSSEEIGCPDGTTMIVRNLFYNTPARRKFLKSPTTEAGYVSDLVGRLALSHPDISFKFIYNGQNKLHTSGNANLKDIIYQIYGRGVTGQLLSVSADTPICKITGYIGKPILSRGNRSWENYFINGRYIKSNIITKAIEDAYKTFVMIHKYPFTVLHIEIAQEMIDVNVHPRKMEIRFNENETLYNTVYELVRSVLEQRELIPSVTLDKKEEKKEMVNQEAPEPFELQRLAAMGEQNKNKWHQQETFQKAHSSKAIHDEMPKKSYNANQFQPETMKVHESDNHLYGNREKKTNLSTGIPHFKQTDMEQKIANEMSQNALEQVNHRSNSELEASSIKNQSSNLDIHSSVTARHMPETASVKKGSQEVTAPTPKDSKQLGLFGEDERLLDARARAKHRLVGQVFDTYWIVEYDGKMFIIDQHAAHEKVLYERLMKDFSKKAMQKQMLSPPVVLSLSMQEENIYKRYEDYFAELGFEIDVFGGREYAICGVPLQLFGMNARDIFIEILDSLSEESRRLDGSAITDRIATMACKAAVKGNNKLSFEEADSLIDQLLLAENPYTCPHGRPTIISLSKYELEKKFKRIQ